MRHCKYRTAWHDYNVVLTSVYHAAVKTRINAMAKEQSDREDIMREATALTRRVSLELSGFPELVIVGFRRNSAMSIFVDQDPVYQFNSAGEFRRGYLDGKLIKADQGKLSSLDRQHKDDQVVLMRHDFDDAEQEDFISQLHCHLDQLHQSLSDGSFQVKECVPVGDDVVTEIISSLDLIGTPVVIADQPNCK